MARRSLAACSLPVRRAGRQHSRMSAAETQRPARLPEAVETTRLRLRPLVERDSAFILELVNDPAWLRYIGDRGVRTLADANRYIVDGPQRSYALHGFGLMLVERREDGTPIGLCGLIRRESLPDVDLGFALAPVARGHGYAVEAARATLEQARSVHRLTRIVAITTPDNAASQSVLERLGFRFE